LERDAPRDFRNWKHAGDVDELVNQVDAVSHAIPPAEHPLRRGEQGPGAPDWEGFRGRVGSTIDRHRYERVRYCRDSLKKALDARGPWESPFVALRSGLTKYSQPPGRPVTSAQADAVVKALKRWCDQIDDEREYEFKILNLPADWRVEVNRR